MDITMEQAVQKLLEESCHVAEYEEIAVQDTPGRVLAEDVRAGTDQPPFDRSPLDGFAFHHGDVAQASRENPVTLRITQVIYAGDAPEGILRRGEAACIMTGAPLPPGATCVVRQEAVEWGDGFLRVAAPMKENENICFCGEDIREGQVIAAGGTRLNSAYTGVLAAQGVSIVKVFRRVKAGVLSTGSELQLPGSALARGKIFDANGAMLAARVAELGEIAVVGENGRDCPEALQKAVAALLAQTDMVVTTGAIAVGERDYMPQVAQELGGELLFRGVAMKPGGWATAYKVGRTVLLCLSGNPFAAAATFELLAVPLLLHLAGEGWQGHKRVDGILQTPFAKWSHGRRFVRAYAEGGRISIPQADHSSGSLSSYVSCNCLLDIPAGTPPLQQGGQVAFIPLRGRE